MVGRDRDGEPFFEFGLSVSIGLLKKASRFATQYQVNWRLGVFGQIDHNLSRFFGVANGHKAATFEVIGPFFNGFLVPFNGRGIAHGVTRPVGTETAGLNAGDPYVKGSYFFAEGFAKATQPKFSGLVDGHARPAYPSAYRTDLQNSPRPLPTHMGQYGPGYRDGRIQIRFQLTAYLFVREGFRSAGYTKSGIVYQHIDTPKPGYCLFHRSVDLHFIRYIQLNGVNLIGIAGY